MPQFSLTDSLGSPLQGIKVDWTSASALYKYGKAEGLHLLVFPDFIAKKDQPLSVAAPTPATFQLKLGEKFQLGDTQPEIDLTPGTQILVRANAGPGTNLFDDDQFRVAALVPANTGYVGLSVTGSLDLGISGSAGDLTFGFGANSAITFDFLKAFETGSGEPTLGDATARMLSNYALPGDLPDLIALGDGDICAISGQGSLQVSAGFTIATPTNPLASVDLPLGVGTIQVQDGAMTGITASLTLSGSYQLRVRKLPGGLIELSYLTGSGAKLVTDLTASVGASVTLGSTDLLAKLLGAIGTDKINASALAGLTDDEVSTFTSAIQDGINHSLAASLDLALSSENHAQVAFQYYINPTRLDAQGTVAVRNALKGNLSALTALEAGAAADGTIAPGITLRNSVVTTMQAKGVTLNINLLGIVNVLSLATLIKQCEVIHDPATGDIMIKETITGQRINAIVNPFQKQAALRKALFDSVVVTSTYVAGHAVTLTQLRCETMHFATNENTNQQTIADYLNWIVVLGLLSPQDAAGLASHWSGGGLSTCVLRTALDQAACEALFFAQNNALRNQSEYLQIGRQVLQQLLAQSPSSIDQLRHRFLSDDATWQQAVAIGPNPGLRPLLPVSADSAQRDILLADVSGDLYDIVWWAQSMRDAGNELQTMRQFLAGRSPDLLADDPDFAQRRKALQAVMSKVVKNSKARFDQPWGLICLRRAAAPSQSSARIASKTLTVRLPS